MARPDEYEYSPQFSEAPASVLCDVLCCLSVASVATCLWCLRGRQSRTEPRPESTAAKRRPRREHGEESTEAFGKMANRAPQGVAEGLTDLPQVRGLPSLRLDVMRDILTGHDADAVVNHLESRWCQRGIAEGDDAALDAQAMDDLLADQDTVDEMFGIFFEADFVALATTRGWPPKAFFACNCSLKCMEELARKEDGQAVLDKAVARINAAKERPSRKRRRQEGEGGGGSGSTWLQQTEELTVDLLRSVLGVHDAASCKSYINSTELGNGNQNSSAEIAEDFLHDITHSLKSHRLKLGTRDTCAVGYSASMIARRGREPAPCCGGCCGAASSSSSSTSAIASSASSSSASERVPSSSSSSRCWCCLMS